MTEERLTRDGARSGVSVGPSDGGVVRLPNVRGLTGYANVMDSAALLVRGFHLHYARMTNLYVEGTAHWGRATWDGEQAWAAGKEGRG